MKNYIPTFNKFINERSSSYHSQNSNDVYEMTERYYKKGRYNRWYAKNVPSDKNPNKMVRVLWVNTPKKNMYYIKPDEDWHRVHVYLDSPEQKYIGSLERTLKNEEPFDFELYKRGKDKFTIKRLPNFGDEKYIMEAVRFYFLQRDPYESAQKRKRVPHSFKPA